MANQQAMSMIHGAMRRIEQNEAALRWLEGYRASMVADKSLDYGLKVGDTRGSGLTGFKEAKFLLDDWLKNSTMAMIVDAETAARRHIKEAEAQIKEWSAKL